MSHPRPTLLPALISDAAAAETMPGVRRDNRPRISLSQRFCEGGEADRKGSMRRKFMHQPMPSSAEDGFPSQTLLGFGRDLKVVL